MRLTGALGLLALVGCDVITFEDPDAPPGRDTDDGLVGTPVPPTPEPTVIPTDLDCGQTPIPTPDPGGAGLAECVTGTMRCGETLQATQVGGSTFFGTENGENLWQCSGSAEGADFAGPERVYAITPPSDVYAIEARLRSCAPSWLLWHRSATSCSDEPITCNYALEGGLHDPYDVLIVGQLGTVHFIVEPYRSEGDNFELTLICFAEDGTVVTE